jgi:hypothetical protein
MVNHLRRKGYLSELDDYISELEGKPEIKLGNRDKQFLAHLIYKPEYPSRLRKNVNELYRVNPSLDRGARNTKKSINSKHVIHYLLAGSLSKPAALDTIKKLLKYELIKPINKSLVDKGLLEGLGNSNLTREIIAANQKRAKLVDITEYGLFCFLSQVSDFTPSMLVLHWQSKTMKLLLSPYFEKKTVASDEYSTMVVANVYLPTTIGPRVIGDFLQEALHIVNRKLSIIDNETGADNFMFEGLNKNKKVKKYRTGREKQIAELEDDLEWHAKAFVLRLMVDTASKDRDKRKESRYILDNFLAYDEKFIKLKKDTMHEILSYYEGRKLLELDKTLNT